MTIQPFSNSGIAPTAGVQQNGSATSNPDPYRIVIQALRGRYLLTVALALAFAIAGGWVGYRFQRPSFRSEGLIRIAFSPRPLTTEGDETRQMSVFQEFLHTQVLALTSHSLVERAIRDPAWIAVGRDASSPNAAGAFARHLDVDHPPRTEHLRITFTDNDPVAAAAGVNASLAAYSELYGTDAYRGDQDRIRILEAQRTDLESRLSDVQSRIVRIAGEFGSTQFGPLYAAKMEEVAKLESVLADTRIALAVAEHRPTASKALDSAPSELTLNQITLLDPLMREYVVERNRLEAQLLQNRATGALDGNPDVVRLNSLLTLQDDRIKRLADDFRRSRAGAVSVPGGESHIGGISGQSIDSLRQSEQELNRLCESSRAAMVALGSKAMQIDSMKTVADDITKKLVEVDREIDGLKLQGILGGKLQIVSRGAIPALPVMDPRPKAALAGAAGASALPITAMVLLGIVRRRHWRPDEPELHSRGVRLLGAIPLLPTGNADPQRAALYAYCNHQIRIMLQVLRTRDQPAVYLVTSPCAGDGKTRLTQMLGASFAQSGSKTLVIDCDMIGRGLTRAVGATHLRGMVESLRSGTMPDYVIGTDVDRMWVLPAGDEELQGGELSPDSMRRLLAEARGTFDTILIDTGPALSCIEASLLASEVDGVILTITRGQPQPLVERTIRHLHEIGAKTVGMVFNRARPGDMLAYGYGSFRGAARPPRESVLSDPGDEGLIRSNLPPVSIMRRSDPAIRAVSAQRLRNAPPAVQDRAGAQSDP